MPLFTIGSPSRLLPPQPATSASRRSPTTRRGTSRDSASTGWWGTRERCASMRSIVFSSSVQGRGLKEPGCILVTVRGHRGRSNQLALAFSCPWSMCTAPMPSSKQPRSLRIARGPWSSTQRPCARKAEAKAEAAAAADLAGASPKQTLRAPRHQHQGEEAWRQQSRRQPQPPPQSSSSSSSSSSPPPAARHSEATKAATASTGSS